MSTRQIDQLIQGMPTADGAGVKLVRTLGSRGDATRVDPFLMLDEFSSTNADDYSAGFPDHPHRGFETVTYMLAGHMLHEDHMGNRGDLLPGMVQWMTAGRGVIHSEMPQQSEGRMHGFQLWLNLPARDKLKPARYRDIAADEIPTAELTDGGRVRVIAGQLQLSGRSLSGPINPSGTDLPTEPLYLDIELPAGARFEQALSPEHNAFIYVFEGSARVGEVDVAQQHVGRLGAGNRLVVDGGEQGARMLLLAGRPLNEPIVQHGPFVMNSRAEIEQAVQDYTNGTLTQATTDSPA